MSYFFQDFEREYCVKPLDRTSVQNRQVSDRRVIVVCTSTQTIYTQQIHITIFIFTCQLSWSVEISMEFRIFVNILSNHLIPFI